MKKTRPAWHIGTSGWSYKHWKGLYYPEKMKPADYLEYYSREFGCTEINTSFYRLPKEETVLSWIQQVPPTFVFCPKLSRYMSHFKKLRDPVEGMQVYFSVFDQVQERLGPYWYSCLNGFLSTPEWPKNFTTCWLPPINSMIFPWKYGRKAGLTNKVCL